FCLLGHGSILRAQCADERLDRPCVPSCRNRFLPAADTKSASSVATETVFQHACFFIHLSPVARSGGSVKPRSRANSGDSLVLFLLCCLILSIGLFFLLSSEAPTTRTDLSQLLTNNPEKYTLSFGHILDLTPHSLGDFRVSLLGFSLAFLIGTGLNRLLRSRG